MPSTDCTNPLDEKEWTEMHEKFEEFCKTVVVKTSGRSVVRAR